MARIRTIKPEFWTDSKTGTLSLIATKLFLGLLNHSDDYGIVRYDLMEFKAKIMPYENGSAMELLGPPLLDEILPRGLATILSVDKVMYLHITNFEKHQKVDKPGKPLIDGWKPGMTPDDFGATYDNYQVLTGVETESHLKQLENPREDSRIFALEGKGKERKGKEKPQQQHAHAKPDVGDQILATLDDHQADLERLFPEVNLATAGEKLVVYSRKSKIGPLLDPWLTVIKWFEREFPRAQQPKARASPVSYAEKWRMDAAIEAEAFVSGGEDDQDHRQQGGSAAIPIRNGCAL